MFERCLLLVGVFVLLQVYAFLQYLKDRLTRHEFQTLFILGVSVAAGVVFLSVIYLTYTGWFPDTLSPNTHVLVRLHTTHTQAVSDRIHCAAAEADSCRQFYSNSR